MSETLDEARRLFEAGKYRAACATLWELECQVRGGDDTGGAQGLLDLASALRERTRGNIRNECDSLVACAHKALGDAATPNFDATAAHAAKASPWPTAVFLGMVAFVGYFIHGLYVSTASPLEIAINSLVAACVVAALVRTAVFVFATLQTRRGASETAGLGQEFVAGAAAPMSLPVAVFNQTTGWPGRTITFEETRRQFVLQDHGPITAQDVLGYDAHGQLDWGREGLRDWVDDFAEQERDPRSDTLAAGPSEDSSTAPQVGSFGAIRAG